MDTTDIGTASTQNENANTATVAADFVRFAIASDVLRFGSFVTKAGRTSPYFFNAGLFDDGAKLHRLAQFYAHTIVNSQVRFDMLFGPAYKGIPLVAAIAVELARQGKNFPFAYNRKEKKDHGEGGTLVGAPLQGRVLIVDDVMSAGTAVRESIAMIQAANATPCAVAVALDRQEKAQHNGVMVNQSAVQFVERELGLDVVCVATLDDLLNFLKNDAAKCDMALGGTASDTALGKSLGEYYAAVQAYRLQYGVQA